MSISQPIADSDSQIQVYTLHISGESADNAIYAPDANRTRTNAHCAHMLESSVMSTVGNVAQIRILARSFGIRFAIGSFLVKALLLSKSLNLSLL